VGEVLILFFRADRTNHNWYSLGAFRRYHEWVKDQVEVNAVIASVSAAILRHGSTVLICNRSRGLSP
jgi:hypothetical protein